MALKGAEGLKRRIAAVSSKYVPMAIMKKWQMLTVRYAKLNAVPHRKTGNLERSIHAGEVTKLKATVEASAAYAAIVEFGSKAHIIVPVHAKVLAWGGARRQTGSLRSGSSATIFAMKVRHPGTRPYPYLKPAAEKALQELGVDTIITAWNEAA